MPASKNVTPPPPPIPPTETEGDATQTVSPPEAAHPAAPVAAPTADTTQPATPVSPATPEATQPAAPVAAPTADTTQPVQPTAPVAAPTPDTTQPVQPTAPVAAPTPDTTQPVAPVASPVAAPTPDTPQPATPVATQPETQPAVPVDTQPPAATPATPAPPVPPITPTATQTPDNTPTGTQGSNTHPQASPAPTRPADAQPQPTPQPDNKPTPQATAPIPFGEAVPQTAPESYTQPDTRSAEQTIADNAPAIQPAQPHTPTAPIEPSGPTPTVISVPLPPGVEDDPTDAPDAQTQSAQTPKIQAIQTRPVATQPAETEAATPAAEQPKPTMHEQPGYPQVEVVPAEEVQSSIPQTPMPQAPTNNNELLDFLSEGEEAGKPAFPVPAQAYRPPDPDETIEPLQTATTPASARRQTDNPTIGGTPWQGDLQKAHAPEGVSGKVVAMIGAKGGAGKTTTILWLAQTLKASGDSVIVVDADIAKPNVASHLGLFAPDLVNKGLSALFNAPKIHSSLVSEACIPIKQLGVFLPGPLSEMPHHPPQAIKTLIEVVGVLRLNFDWILLDLPPATLHDPMLKDFALKDGMTDQMIVLGNSFRSTLSSTKEFLTAASRPFVEGGLDLDLSKCVGLLSHAQLTHNITYEQVTTWFPEIPWAGEIPHIPGVADQSNANEWRAPKSAMQGLVNFTSNVFARVPEGVEEKQNQKQKPASAKSLKKKANKKKKRKK